MNPLAYKYNGVAHFYAAIIKADGRTTDKEREITEDSYDGKLKSYRHLSDHNEEDLTTLLTLLEFKSLTSEDHIKVGIQCLNNNRSYNIINDLDIIYENCERIANVDRINKKDKEVLDFLLSELLKFKKDLQLEKKIAREAEEAEEAEKAREVDDNQDKESHKGDKKAGCSGCLIWIIAFMVVAIWRWEDTLRFLEFISN